MSDVPARLLRETLRGRAPTGSPSGCVDTDTLAAWSDGTLSAGERAAVELHASDCARCQALLAAMARTTPPEPAHEGWRRLWLSWLIPLAAAAAAVVVWINVPGPTQPEKVATPSRPAAAALEKSELAPALRALPSTPREEPQISPDGSADSRNADAKQRLARGEETRPTAVNGAAPGAASQLAPGGAPNGERNTAAAPSRAAAVAGDSAKIAVREAAESTRDTASAAATPARGFDVATSGSGLEKRSLAALAEIQILSPNPNVRWRLVAGGGVERSIDGGATWQPQSTGVLATLTAGAAPSPTICWLVGRGGMVVLSIDGRTWQRVPIPETIDLRFVSAADATNATVTAADGRTFTTLDGGKTWRAR